MNRWIYSIVAVSWILGLNMMSLAQEKKPALLVVNEYPKNFITQSDSKVGEALQAAGWIVKHDNFESLTWDYAKQFNVILVATSIDRKKLDILRQFVENGGGLFYMHAGYQSSAQDIKEASVFFEPYGLKILSEYYYEPSTKLTFRNQESHVHPSFARIDAIQQSPVSIGVTNVWIPFCQFDKYFFSYHLVINPGEGWQLVMKGSPTAYSSVTENTEKITPEKGTFKESPPLMAVAEKGEGRMAVWPVHSTFCIYSGYHWFWEGRMMETGDGMVKSDGLKLFMNTLNWLADPSLKSGKLGGYVFVPVSESWKKERMQKEPGLIEYDWDKVEFIPKPEACYVGLIGAHTALSGGKGTVKDYVSAAKTAGYQFIAFTESLPELTAEKFEQLKKDCKAVSGADFAAVPGIECQDEVGNAFVVWGFNTYYPLPEHFSKKEKGRIKNIYVFLSMGKEKEKDGNHPYGTWPAITAVKTGLNPKPPEFLTAIRSVALFTYERGKPIDDAVKLYWHVQEQGYFLFPSVVHLIYSPDEVAQARQGDWQFYVLPKLQDYQRPPILSKDVDKVVAGLYETCSFPAARPGYASSGPKILNYQLINPGKSDLSLKENERQRMRFDVHADKGLKEVLLQDGQKMVRRWLPKGNDFSKTLDLFHDQQRQYILVVTDQQGGKCISHVIGTSVQTHGFFMNGDNQNVRDGSCWQGVPAEGDEESLQAATDPALQMGGPPVGIEAYSPAGKQISSHFGFFGVIDGKYQGLDTDIRAMDHVCRLAGEFCVIRDGIVRNLYPRSHPNSVYGYSGKTFAPMYPTQYIDWMTRGYSFASVLSGPPGELVCFIKKDIVAPKEQFVLIASMPLEKIVIRPDGKGRVLMETVRAGSYRGGEGKLEYGDYVASFDIGQVTQEGGFISAQKDGWPLYYKIVSSSRPGSSRIYLYSKSPNPGETLKAGAELRWRYYLSVGPRTLQPNNRRFEELRGRLLGKAPYQCDPKVGKVLDAGVALSVEADHGGFAAGFKGSTEDIALIVNGLNERWSAGVWHKGETPIRYYTKDYYGTWQVKCLRRKETDAIRRFGVWEGKGYYVVEKGDRDVFAGNFIVCDNPEIVLALVHATKDRKEVVVHNPTDKAVTVTVTPAPGFMLFGDFKKVLTIEAGQDEMLKL